MESKSFRSMLSKVTREKTYIYTVLPDDYVQTETQYRETRDLLVLLKSSVKRFVECGKDSHPFRGITEKLATDEYTKIQNEENIFQQLWMICEKLAMMNSHDTSKKELTSYSHIIREIKTHKDEMNIKLEELMKLLDNLRTETKEIDLSRNEFKDARSDYERLLKAKVKYDEKQKDFTDDDKLEHLRVQYEIGLDLTRKKMDKFVGGIGGIIITLRNVQTDFYKQALKSFEKFIV